MRTLRLLTVMGLMALLLGISAADGDAPQRRRERR